MKLIVILSITVILFGSMSYGPASFADYTMTIDTHRADDAGPGAAQFYIKSMDVNLDFQKVLIRNEGAVFVIDSSPSSLTYNSVVSLLPDNGPIFSDKRSGYMYSIKNHVLTIYNNRHSLGQIASSTNLKECNIFGAFSACYLDPNMAINSNNGEIYVPVTGNPCPSDNGCKAVLVIANQDEKPVIKRHINLNGVSISSLTFNPNDNNLYGWREIYGDQNPALARIYRIATAQGAPDPVTTVADIGHEIEPTLTSHQEGIQTMAYNPHNRLLYIVDAGTRYHAGAEVCTPDNPNCEDEEKQFLECGNDGVIHTVDPLRPGPDNMKTVAVGPCPSAIAFSGDGRAYVTNNDIISGHGEHSTDCIDKGKVSVIHKDPVHNPQVLTWIDVGRCPRSIVYNEATSSMYVENIGIHCGLGSENLCPRGESSHPYTFSMINTRLLPTNITTTLIAECVGGVCPNVPKDVTGLNIPVGISIHDTAVLSSMGTEFKRTTFKVTGMACQNIHEHYFRCQISSPDSEAPNEINCYGRWENSSPYTCLSNDMRELRCAGRPFGCEVLSNNFQINIRFEECRQNENRPTVLADVVSERFSCVASSPTNTDLRMIHCSGLLEYQSPSDPRICIDNNSNRLTCDLSVIALFCHAFLPIPQGEVVYAIFPNSDCRGAADSKETVELKEFDVVHPWLPFSIPNSRTLVGGLGAISYQAHYSGDQTYRPWLSNCEPVTFLPIFTQILDERGRNITGTTVHFGDTVRDSATIHRLPTEPFTGKVTYYMFNSSDTCSGPRTSETVDVQPDGKVPHSSPHNMTSPHNIASYQKFSYAAVWDRFPELNSLCEPLYVQ